MEAGQQWRIVQEMLARAPGGHTVVALAVGRCLETLASCVDLASLAEMCLTRLGCTRTPE